MSEPKHDRNDMAKAQKPRSEAGKQPAADGPANTSDAAEQGSAPARGAGGTSAAAPESGEANGPSSKGGAAKVAGAAAAVPAAGAAGQIMILAMFINFLKGMMMALAALATNVWGMAVGLALAAGKAVVGAIMGFGGMISGAVGGAVSAAAAGVTSAVAAAAVTAMVIVGAVVGITGGSDLALKDGRVDCQVGATTALAKIDGSAGSVDAMTLANAKTVYGVLSAWGMPDENIAGIIGNWDAESGVDPTSVQDDFSSPQMITDVKKTTATNTDKGIGLGQWTFGRNANLRAYATGISKDWWTLETQLGFMLSAAEGADAAVVKDMIATPYGTPAEAAIYFHSTWERSADTASMASRRGVSATKWMGLFSGWTKDQALADSILAQSGTTVTGANSSRSQAVRADCLGVGGAVLTAKEGGLTFEEATAMMALYRTEGRTFLEARYGSGGPGDCGNGDKSDNCVGFSTYFVNKYTSFQQYAHGDGIDTAGSMASMMGKTLSTTPTVYSVASGPASGPEGHTFVVLGIQGDQAVIGEASCGSNHKYTRARLIPLSELTGGAWKFVDVSDLITKQPSA
ncbi:phage tail tip lysozyme [Cryobacterium zhongshanensis]|uniref:Phage tail tip lysozyme n=1 Tax=Cryobacterium zhongshanensis TaxID=2928153 RepID=A0AA41UH64_9MICO|nr:phage tail tip lysozyme [Cryobacterium zhongshanensis]MCI4659585.1 phage tail tip lysozyme [Cryobacterium zhongshanensis]